MNADGKVILLLRVLVAAGGLDVAAMSGTILIILLIIFTGSTFGLTNIWSGTVAGVVIGTTLGFLSPRIGKFAVGLFAGPRYIQSMFER